MIDASVAVKWYLRDEDLLVQADQFRVGIETRKLSATAPQLSRYEVASALLIGVRARRITRVGMDDGLSDYDFLELADGHDTSDVLLDAAHLLVEHPIGYYDGVYLAMAEALGGHFVTADAKFYKKARDLFPSVVWLGDIDL